MNVEAKRVRACLNNFEFKKLFIEELNWTSCGNRPIIVPLEDETYCATPFAELGGVVTFLVESQKTGEVPPSSVRRVIEQKIKKQVHEHILVFVDSKKTKSVWQWVRRGAGKETATREHSYYKGQPGDSLIQKLDGIAFQIEEFDDEGRVSVMTVLSHLEKALDVEKVTKRFYDEFKKEHDTFSTFLKGLDGQEEIAWYASVMLNRLMFIYFIEKKGFLNGDKQYLAHKLAEVKKQGANRFYKYFLVPLFFEGFAKEKGARTNEINRLLGKVPYFNGGLFLPHKLETLHGNDINVSDAAFERLFALFEEYNWHLDYRPSRNDNEINPDVLGYIFEKYINQKQMGAYYTKEDITGYLCKNTIIPFLFDKLDSLPLINSGAFPIKDIEPYIYDAVKTDVHLPTETDREYQARQKRFQQIKADFASGKINGVNDLITYNLDVFQFIQDWANDIKDPQLLRAFYFQCLIKLTVLDPTVGSGAFLFAALNILEPLYEICLDKMEELGGPKYDDFTRELKRVALHPNRTYFILKSIIINNLFGVDIMEEAVEICKLRLFLKLVAQLDDPDRIEPLPDIDFNIRAGNTLVGYANMDEIKKAKATQLDLSGAMKDIEDKIKEVDRSLQFFRDVQVKDGIASSVISGAKAEVKAKLDKVNTELNKDLAALYGARNVSQFVKSYQPFHWLAEFYGIMKNGGFDVIIGNPPYVAYVKVKKTYTLPPNLYRTEACGNLYCFIMERTYSLLRKIGRFGMIVPVSLVSGESYQPIANITFSSGVWVSTYSNRPGKIFKDVEQRLTIILRTQQISKVYSTYYQHWYEEERPYLMDKLFYFETRLHTKRKMPYKIGSTTGRNILDKILVKKNTLTSFEALGEYFSYYHDGPTYWIRALNFEPNIGLKSDRSNHYHRLACLTLDDSNILTAIMSSSTFYYFFKILSNCRDFGNKEFEEYKIGLLSSNEKNKLAAIGAKLGERLRETAALCSRNYPSGTIEYEEYYPWKAKDIIDEIDTILAKHYGFTDEELDFIINYDIKYRMGKGNGEEEE
jgi:hypothetical protein